MITYSPTDHVLFLSEILSPRSSPFEDDVTKIFFSDKKRFGVVLSDKENIKWKKIWLYPGQTKLRNSSEIISTD